MRYKQLKWYDHVQRMNEESLPRKILEWWSTWKKKKKRKTLKIVDGGSNNRNGSTEENGGKKIFRYRKM